MALEISRVGERGRDVPGFGPAAEPLLFRRKWPKPLTPRLASLKRRAANPEKADQLARLTQGPQAEKSVPPLGQPAGVGSTLTRTETNARNLL